MSKYLLRITCPACGNSTISQFYDECGGKRYIDEDLNLIFIAINAMMKHFFLMQDFNAGIMMILEK